MSGYVVRRLLLYVPTLIGVSIIIFVIMRVIPGDPAVMVLSGPGGEAVYTQEDLVRMHRILGLDRPLVVQYADWMWGFVRGDWGISLRYNADVFEEVRRRLPVTAELAMLGMFIAVAIGLPVGLISAMRQETWADYVGRVFTIVGLAMPTFWLGMLVVVALSTWFNWLPPLGYAKLHNEPWGNLQQMSFPALVLGYHMAAYIARMVRAQMLEVLRQDYIRTAHAKGLRERVVVVRHALKNALLPVITLAGVLVGGLLSGAVVIELIFSLPGIGRLLLDGLRTRDFPVVQALVLVFATIFLMVNLLVDLLYGWLDPRIHY
ncbi:MAG: ABC transporter permease [Chloroflexota bacterium]|nr:ABC transporter permease [Chloroflexota bacterium]